MDNKNPGRKITVQIARLCDKVDLSATRIERLVNVVCARFGLQRAVISIAIVDDGHISRLNKQFLKRRRNTDCLSFDLSDSRKAHERCFEIIVNAELAVRCAEKAGHSPQAELALYITHGLLHQLGFDDRTPSRARKMHQTEEQILQQFGYDFVYD